LCFFRIMKKIVIKALWYIFNLVRNTHLEKSLHYQVGVMFIQCTCRNPTLAKCAGEAQHLEKVRIWSPLGLPNVQSSTTTPKTPRIEVFLVSLKRSWSVDIENVLALIIWTYLAQVMGKRRAGSQIDNLTPDHKKSGIDLFPTFELRARYVVGKISTRATSLVQTSSQSDLAVGSYDLPKSRDSNRDSFGTILGLQLGSPRKKKPFGCSLGEVAQRILYGGRWWLPPSPGRGVSRCPKCPWLVPTPKGVPECELTTWVVCFDADSCLIY
jgi:hypothetical protein